MLPSKMPTPSLISNLEKPMKKLIFYFLLTLNVNCAFGNQTITPPSIKDPKEIIDLQLKSLDHLKACTMRTLQQMTQLRSLIEHYKQTQETYLDHTDNQKLLRSMLHAAEDVLNAIKEWHMQHLFDAEFIAELNLLHKLNQNVSLPKAPKATP